MIIGGFILSYFIIMALVAGWLRHLFEKDSNDHDDDVAASIVLSIIWPLSFLLLIGIFISNLSKDFFDNRFQKSLIKQQKQLNNLKNVRIELEDTRKKIQQEQEIIAQLEEELKGNTYETSAR